MTKKMTPEEKKKLNRKKGRPTTYQEIYNEIAYRMCLLGATDIQLAKMFDVSEVTLNAWKNKYPLFIKSIKEGKEVADANVASSLYETAISGNTTAQIFWLKNRQSRKWRDKQEIKVDGEVSLFKMKTMKDPEDS